MLALLSALKQDMPNIRITEVKRRHFNEGQGFELINRIRTEECATIDKDIRDK